jgi:hypothetical protein
VHLPCAFRAVGGTHHNGIVKFVHIDAFVDPVTFLSRRFLAISTGKMAWYFVNLANVANFVNFLFSVI